MKWVVVIGFFMLLNCQKRQEHKQPVASVPISEDSIQRQDSLEEEMDVQQEKYKKYWGYRFHIEGDFDGDKREDTLIEKLISARTGQEIAKFCGFEKDSRPDCWWTWRINQFRQPQCFLQCSNTNIGDFIITKSNFLSVGLLFLQNEGDLNGDGRDEVAFIEDGGNCDGGGRTMSLATFKKKRWKIITEFSTRGGYPEMDNWDNTIITPEDLTKPTVKNFENDLKQPSPYFKKKGRRVFYKTYESPEEDRKELKINW